ncbi:cupin domain-containing protein [Leeia sp. TBRC 13508]|uniref:Cupin domain-containing protein n=1 Tax=Leeia speluncae TaxID=2884804 RepID=A0ABS8D2W0_9NEIS|nr:cupin domain-containing protein [Leeia speluncae]MCB6181983.1 cupin domain-containing protein [Leeia speluncae]
MNTQNLSPIPALDQPLDLLGGLTVRQFLDEYWQKKPLYIPNAIAGFEDLVTFEQLVQFAAQDDVISRLVTHKGDDWQLAHGPLAKKQFAKLPKSDWAMLVQNLNHLLPEANALLQRFNFIPYARLDDLMISWAPTGGGVGPHFDSYDVFLLQGSGEKRWQISSNCDKALIPDIPLRILSNFTHEHEWTLKAGDMLYLPPHCAHYGTQLSPGTTYSIGFRTPSHQELATEFLMYAADNLKMEGMYADPDLKPQTNPGQIGDEMIAKCRHILSQIQWDDVVIGQFLSGYLSEPKQHVWFEEPEYALEEDEFAEALQANGLVLNEKSTCLYFGDVASFNGEPVPDDFSALDALHQMADRRGLPPAEYDELFISWLHELYLNGWVHINDE